MSGKQGVFQEINLGFALPEVWVQFESDSEISVPTSCNPLDLELLERALQPDEKTSSMSELSEPEATSVATVEVVEVLEELTGEEASERHRLELKVERAFYEAGAALRQIRDRRLFRSTHKNFEDYCRERFGFSRRHPYRLIDAALVVKNLEKFCVQFGHILPAKESICRPLTGLGLQQQIQAWQEVMQKTEGKQPTGQVVKDIVERLKSKPLFPATDFCQIGDVFTLTRLEDTERKYNGCPCVAVELKHFTVEVEVHDGLLNVKPENLKKIDSVDISRQLPATLKRIKRVRSVGLLDRGADYVLEGLGRQTYLTDFENKLLSFLEKEHGIESQP